MPKGPRTPAPPLMCERRFEPGRLQDQMLSEAYAQVVSGPEQACSRAARSRQCRAEKCGCQASITVTTSGGICA
jgi:hypothetical protein